ncbi:MAG: BON domain-containing protein, partial [Burkholderiales bacterium]|nr:BON domain-containing protein [Burkholderiales bacterium]
ADPVVPYHAVDVETADGVVTLSGRVDNLLAKSRAARLASTVRGARAVVNQLVVVPHQLLTADALERNVREALRYDPATSVAAIRVQADGLGEVTLGGEVGSYQLRRLAETVASSVAGVTAVDNRITVDDTVARTDGAIEREIEQRMHWNALIDAERIGVTVTGGRVTLTGAVGSLAERDRAVRDAWTAGVRAVDADALEVEPWPGARAPQADSEADSGAVFRSDSAIRDAVSEALLFDPRVDSTKVRIAVSAGVVSLYGAVDTFYAKQSAALVTRDVAGVLRVKNRLKVRPLAELSEAEIAQNVERALARDPFLAGERLSVEVNGRQVVLSGSVDSYFDKAQAHDIAYRAQGVAEVRNRLTVAQPARMGHDPYVDSWRIYDYPWYRPTAPAIFAKSDWAIEQDIEDALAWSPFVDAEQITVTVEDGVATLTGTVESYREFTAAAENALEGGAVEVRNRIEVDPQGG